MNAETLEPSEAGGGEGRGGGTGGRRPAPWTLTCSAGQSMRPRGRAAAVGHRRRVHRSPWQRALFTPVDASSAAAHRRRSHRSHRLRERCPPLAPSSSRRQGSRPTRPRGIIGLPTVHRTGRLCGRCHQRRQSSRHEAIAKQSAGVRSQGCLVFVGSFQCDQSSSQLSHFTKERT